MNWCLETCFYIFDILGVLNYELHMPLVISAQMAVNTGIMDTSEACKEFQKAIKCLEECMHHLQYEPTGNFENQLYLGKCWNNSSYSVWELLSHSTFMVQIGNLPATQILRETNVCESRVSKSAILAVILPQNFSFGEFLHFVRA